MSAVFQSSVCSRAGIGLGANLGQRLEQLIAARDRLRALAAPGTEFWQSPVYQTKPVDCPADSPDFFNAVIELGFAGTAHELASHLHAIERDFGRPAAAPRNAPRVIDLDLLYFDQLQLTDPALTIPHPRMRRRRFVLQPLADIRASLRLPGDSADILALLHSLSTDEQPLTLVTAVW